AQALAQFRLQDARGDVGAASGGKGHHQPQGGVALRAHGGRECQGGGNGLATVESEVHRECLMGTSLGAAPFDAIGKSASCGWLSRSRTSEASSSSSRLIPSSAMLRWISVRRMPIACRTPSAPPTVAAELNE